MLLARAACMAMAYKRLCLNLTTCNYSCSMRRVSTAALQPYIGGIFSTVKQVTVKTNCCVSIWGQQ